MHRNARKDQLLSSSGFRSARWVLLGELKIAFSCTTFFFFFFEPVEIEQGQDRAKSSQKASLQNPLKNEMQHLPWCPFLRQFRSFPKACAVATGEGWKRLKGQMMPCFGFREQHFGREQPALATEGACAHTSVLEGFLVSLGQLSPRAARRMQQG